MLNEAVAAVAVVSVTAVTAVGSPEASTVAASEASSGDGSAKDVGRLGGSRTDAGSRTEVSSGSVASASEVGSTSVRSGSVGSGSVGSGAIAAMSSVGAIMVSGGNVEDRGVDASGGGRGWSGAGLVRGHSSAEARAVSDVLDGAPAAVGATQAVRALLVAHAVTGLPTGGAARGVVLVVAEAVGAGDVLSAMLAGSSTVATPDETGVSGGAGNGENNEDLHSWLSVVCVHVLHKTSSTELGDG